MLSSVALVLLLVNLSSRQVCGCKLAIAILVLDPSRAPRGRMRALQMMKVKSKGRVIRMRGESLSSCGDIKHHECSYHKVTIHHANFVITELLPITSSEA